MTYYFIEKSWLHFTYIFIIIQPIFEVVLISEKSTLTYLRPSQKQSDMPSCPVFQGLYGPIAFSKGPSASSLPIFMMGTPIAGTGQNWPKPAKSLHPSIGRNLSVYPSRTLQMHFRTSETVYQGWQSQFLGQPTGSGQKLENGAYFRIGMVKLTSD